MLSQQGWQKKGTGSLARALPQLVHSTGRIAFSARRMMAAMAGIVVRLAELHANLQDRRYTASGLLLRNLLSTCQVFTRLPVLVSGW